MMKNQILILTAAGLAHRLPEHLKAALPAPVWQDADTWRIAVAEDFRLPENLRRDLYRLQIDCALLPDYALHDVGMIVSDMDSTFITIECVDEIAARLGIKEKVAAITERSMRGEIDFAASLTQRVALLAGLPESTLQAVYDEQLKLSPGVPELLSACKKHGVRFTLISGGFTFFTDKLKENYGLDFAYANVLEVAQGRLTGRLSGRLVDAQAKLDLLEKHRIAGKLTLAVGDGANDIPMLQAADIGVAYRAKPKTRAAADCTIDFGGLDGIVRLFRRDC